MYSADKLRNQVESIYYYWLALYLMYDVIVIVLTLHSPCLCSRSDVFTLLVQMHQGFIYHFSVFDYG